MSSCIWAEDHAALDLIELLNSVKDFFVNHCLPDFEVIQNLTLSYLRTFLVKFCLVSWVKLTELSFSLLAVKSIFFCVDRVDTLVRLHGRLLSP